MSVLGATVQRVDAGPEVLLLRARGPGQTWFVIVAAGDRGGVGVTTTRPWKGGVPGGSVPDGEKMRLRSRLEGARVIHLGGRAVTLEKGEARSVIDASASRIVLRAIEAEVGEAIEETAIDEEQLATRGEALAGELAGAAFAGRKAEAARALSKARARVARRIEAVGGDIERIGAADDLAAQAALFVAEAARAARGATRLTVSDWSSGEPIDQEIKLDPARSAREQIDAMFKRARRLKLGAAIAGERLREAEVMASRLAGVAEELDRARSIEEVERAVLAARAAAPRDFSLASASAGSGSRSARKVPEKRPFRAFIAADGGRVLVGRGAAHNDALTLHVARPHDLWLHAKGYAGAHVIVPLDKGQSCPSDLLVDAAHLAAHFSDAREQGVVEVQHTPRRYLRKPKGSAPGFVIVDREKVLVLRVERDRTTRLIAAEEA